MSSLEEHIISILNKENIKFQKEFTFKDLKNGKYRFDFYLEDKNILIEVQGAQHYEFSTLFHKKRADFLKAQQRDRTKISYALAHKIPLYIYPYFDMPQRGSDLFRKKYLATNKYWNDEVWRNFKNKK